MSKNHNSKFIPHSSGSSKEVRVNKGGEMKLFIPNGFIATKISILNVFTST